MTRPTPSQITDRPAIQVAREIPATRAAVASARRAGRPIALVPTMGALHAGHTSLIEAARRDRGAPGFVVVSIFVNPTQFGPHEDFTRYPRPEAADLDACRRAGVDLVFYPVPAEMYAPDASTTVCVAGVTDTLCGPHRPGHFTGVATVVAKLFNIVQPDAAYFGQKDAQQLAVIRRMVRDLNMPIRVVGCPTVREPDGLALSSRNAYLKPAERQQALSLYRALTQARELIAAGQTDAAAILEQMRAVILAAGQATIDYVSIVDPESMQPVARIGGPVLVALAVRIGATRLIDNMTLTPR
jgi:pantoate--beta-alanine ligase